MGKDDYLDFRSRELSETVQRDGKPMLTPEVRSTFIRTRRPATP